MKFPKVKTFRIEDDPKKQALKVLEEAAEFVEAAKQCESVAYMSYGSECYDVCRRGMLSEACDVLIALANCLELFDVDKKELKEMMDVVETFNRMRGRYDR